MRRTPIACCLKEGGEWLSQKRLAEIGFGHIKQPIRLYADGTIEDDLFQERQGNPSPVRNKLPRGELGRLRRYLDF